MPEFEGKLENLKSASLATRSIECPDPTVWRQVAVAVTPSDEALKYLQHASRCDYCGPLLREAVAEMNPNITEAEAKQIAALESARPEWQRRLATRITGTPETATPQPWWRIWTTAPRLAVAGGLTAALALGSWIAARQMRPQTPSDLLAQAYSEQRTFELRMTGASYAPVRVQRGGEGSFMSRPAALLKAEAKIAAEIGSHPSDPNWLQAEARADLLEGKYDSAVTTLRHALQIAPKTPSLLIDLGTAYFQRALAADRPEDLGAAYESLSQALAVEPENSVALFNRAIVAEHQFLFHQALDDWDHYLKLDSSSEWATEAHQHADAVRAKLKEHDQSHAAPLLTPAQIAAQLGNVDLRTIPASGSIGSPELRAQVDQRVEEYLHEAVRTWLPQAYPEGNVPSDPRAVQALFFLADITAQQHGDRWLSDLLSGSSARNFPRAVGAMAATMAASDTGKYESSARYANTALTFFQKSANNAGALYSRFQQAFSAQLLRQSESCQDSAAAALSESEKYPYWWLQVQLGLEQAVCSDITGNFGLGDPLSRQAMERARQSGYDVLYLRALGLLANNKFETANRQVAWKLMMTGFARYWSEQIPTIRGYNLCAIAADAAEGVGFANFHLALRKEVVELSSSEGNLLVRAGAANEAARAAVTAEQPILADRYYKEATRLYSLIHPSRTAHLYELYSRMQMAQVESRLGRSDDAIGELTSIQQDVQSLSENVLTEIFYSTLGQVQLSRHRYPEAEQALNSAIGLVERKLSSLRTEEQRIRWSKDAAPIYAGLAEAKLAQNQIAESLEVYEAYLGTGREGSTNRARDEVFRPPQLAPRLPLLSQQTIVAYGLLPDGLAIWVYDNRGVSAKWYPGKSEKVIDLASRVGELASDPNSDLQSFRREARSLYTLLVAPIEPRLEPGRTIELETDESLATVPFEALLDSGDHYLLERSPVVHTLPTDTGQESHPDRTITVESPALIVLGQAGSQATALAPLPDLETEGEMVASNFHRALVLQGRQATTSQIEAKLSAASVFHFAGHALSNSQQSGLMLRARDPQTQRARLLNADSLAHIETRNLELAVLSACGTANATAEDASGLSSISQAFLRSGVPHVVASRWAVDSVQTRHFVQEFYRALLSETSVSQATRLASMKMLSNPQTAHPYYWSAFAAYGQP